MRRPLSLADVGRGQTVTVRQILFDTLRASCAAAGLREGDTVTLVETDPATVMLLVPGGTAVRCPVEFARFVEAVPNRPAPGRVPASARPARQKGAGGEIRSALHHRREEG